MQKQASAWMEDEKISRGVVNSENYSLHGSAEHQIDKWILGTLAVYAHYVHG